MLTRSLILTYAALSYAIGMGGLVFFILFVGGWGGASYVREVIKAETARRGRQAASEIALLNEETIRSWLRRLDGRGEEGLVRLGEPVNRFPDFVAYLVRYLKVTCPSLGKARIAQMLARAGAHLVFSGSREDGTPKVGGPVQGLALGDSGHLISGHYWGLPSDRVVQSRVRERG